MATVLRLSHRSTERPQSGLLRRPLSTTVVALVLSVIGLTGTVQPACAQGALVDGIVTGPGGLCLDIEGVWTSLLPPKDGTPVLLSVCDGSEDQRWSYAVGDYHGDFIAFGWGTIVSRGGMAVISTEEVAPHAYFLGTGTIQVIGGCLTASDPPALGAPLRVEVCDGRASQQFTMPP